MADLHVRLDQALSDSIDEVKTERGLKSRSDAATYLLTVGLESTRGGMASIHEVLTKLSRDLEKQNQLAVSATVGLAEQHAVAASAIHGSMDLMNRLAIEGLMILRRLAIDADKDLLPAAQVAAREYYSSRASTGAGQATPPAQIQGGEGTG